MGRTLLFSRKMDDHAPDAGQSLANKLQVLVLLRPDIARIVEEMIDKLLARILAE
jgi:hypothetical protein